MYLYADASVLKEQSAFVHTANENNEHLSQNQMTVFWDVTSSNLVEVYLRFRGDCCLHHQGYLVFKSDTSTEIFAVCIYSVSAYIPSFLIADLVY
jgi:hypothetical protein